MMPPVAAVRQFNPPPRFWKNQQKTGKTAVPETFSKPEENYPVVDRRLRTVQLWAVANIRKRMKTGEPSAALLRLMRQTVHNLAGKQK